jgi:hypothetical protein
MSPDQVIADVATRVVDLAGEGHDSFPAAAEVERLYAEWARATFVAIAAWAEEKMTDRDRQNRDGLHCTGLFSGIPSVDRSRAFAIWSSVTRLAHRRQLEQRFAPYSEDQILFRRVPGLFQYIRTSGSRPSELVSASALEFGFHAGAADVRRGSHTLAIDSFLPVPTLHQFLDSAARDGVFVRLNPTIVDAKRSGALNEEVVRPSDPSWWSSGRVFRGKSTGFALVRQKPDHGTDSQLSREYYLLGVRALQGVVSRFAGDRLSIMVEELCEDGENLVGRCLHADVVAPAGASPLNYAAEHIDIAVNYYFRERAIERNQARLDLGQKVEASVRTHLARSDGAPFEMVFAIASSFFRSELLVKEWLDQEGR